MSSVKFVLFAGAVFVAFMQVNERKVIDTGMNRPDFLLQEKPDNTLVRLNTMTGKIVKYDKYSVAAELRDFPALHPIIVNFAISMIIVATFLQFLNVFLLKKDIAWIVFLLVFASLTAALISIGNFYPFATGLVQHADPAPEMHETWAQWTIRSAFLALILQMIHLITRFDKVVINSPRNTAGFSSGRNRMLMTLIAIIMLSSAFCVVRAGHYGAQPVHIEGMGLHEKNLLP